MRFGTKVRPRHLASEASGGLSMSQCGTTQNPRVGMLIEDGRICDLLGWRARWRVIRIHIHTLSNAYIYGILLFLPYCALKWMQEHARIPQRAHAPFLLWHISTVRAEHATQACAPEQAIEHFDILVPAGRHLPVQERCSSGCCRTVKALMGCDLESSKLSFPSFQHVICMLH